MRLCVLDSKLECCQDGWHQAGYRNFGDPLNRERIQETAYSYCPGNDGTIGGWGLSGKNHYAPALYTQSEKGNWYVVPTAGKNRDTIEVFFNIDPSLFYVRTSTPVTVDQEGKLHLMLLPDDGIADFYLFYFPAYRRRLRSSSPPSTIRPMRVRRRTTA